MSKRKKEQTDNMDEPVDFNVLTSRMDEAFSQMNQTDTRVNNLEEFLNSSVATMMSKVDEVLKLTNIRATPTPNTDGATSAAVSSLSLLDLAASGDVAALLRKLEDEADWSNYHQRAENGDTALHIAAREGHLETVTALLGKVKVDDAGYLLRTPLHCAAAHGHLEVVQRLLDAGAQFDVKDAHGDTPMALATENKHKHIVDLLAQRMMQLPQATLEVGSLSHQELAIYLRVNGVSIESCNAEGNSLIVQAARRGRWEIVDFLFARGFSVTECKDPKECLLVLAARAGQLDALRSLLRRGAASDADQVKFGLAEAKSAAVVWAFYDVVPDAVRGDAGKWALKQAARHGRLEQLQALLDLGVDVDSRDGEGLTAIMLAVQYGQIACLSDLLRRGADVNAKANDGDTALHRAASCGLGECVRVLLEAGASKVEKRNDGKTPREVTSFSGIRQLFDTLH